MYNPLQIKSAESKEEKEALKSELWYFLSMHEKMSLAYVNEYGDPVQGIMLYAIDDDLNLFFGTLRRFPKYELMTKNPTVSILVQGEGSFSGKVVTLKAAVNEEFQESERLRELKKWFLEKNTCKCNLKDEEDFVMFKVQIISARILDSNSGTLKRKDINLLN